MPATFATHAARCHTPQQFRTLLDKLRALIPYRYMMCFWGHLDQRAIYYMVNHNFPAPFLRMVFSHFTIPTGPAFTEWRETRSTVVIGDAWNRVDKEIPKDVQEQATYWGVEHGCLGGARNTELFMNFYYTNSTASMPPGITSTSLIPWHPASQRRCIASSQGPC